MKNLVKLKVILLAFIIVFVTNSIRADEILPLPKPLIEEDIKIKTAKKKEIYKRLKKRPNFSIKIVKKLQKLQLSLETKKRKSDYIIKNNFKNKSLKKDVKKVLKKILTNA